MKAKVIIQRCPVCKTRGFRFSPYPVELILKNLPCYNCDRIREEKLHQLKQLEDFQRQLGFASEEIKRDLLMKYSMTELLPLIINLLSNPATRDSSTITKEGIK